MRHLLDIETRAWTEKIVVPSAPQVGCLGDRVADGTGEELALRRVARGVGYEPSTVGMWSCRGPSVESCLDKVLWNPRSRASFLGPQNEYGWVVEASEGQLHVVAVVAEG